MVKPPRTMISSIGVSIRLSYDELTEALQAWLTPSDDEDDSDVEEAVSTSKVADTPVSNTTDAFDELFSK